MNEDADQEWMEEMRNHNYDHVCSMKTFEEKCRSHYELRLNTYTESTDCRLAAYEENLLILGADAAHSCSSLKSKVQRLKVACGKWRIDYQRFSVVPDDISVGTSNILGEVQRRYRKVTVELEGLYMREIGNLLADLASASAQLATYHCNFRVHRGHLNLIFCVWSSVDGSFEPCWRGVADSQVQVRAA